MDSIQLREDYGCDNVTINALSGNDTIRNEGKDATIDGGLGNDFISNNGTNVTLGASYTSVVSGNDVIIAVGDNTITLKDVASLGTLNITGNDGADTFLYDSGDGKDVIIGFGGDDYHISGNKLVK